MQFKSQFLKRIAILTIGNELVLEHQNLISHSYEFFDDMTKFC